MVGWQAADNAYDQMWLIEPVTGSGSDTYTIRNLATGTYMDLKGGEFAYPLASPLGCICNI